MEIHKQTDIQTNKLHVRDALRDLDASSEREGFRRTREEQKQLVANQSERGGGIIIS